MGGSSAKLTDSPYIGLSAMPRHSLALALVGGGASRKWHLNGLRSGALEVQSFDGKSY
jgi:hypothetical protein